MSNLPVTDAISNRNEHLVEAVKAIGRFGGLKHIVFEAIYYHKKRTKTVTEIAAATGLSRMQVLQSAGSLKKAGIVKQDRKDGDTAYAQIESFQHLKPQILSLLKAPHRLKEIATKRQAATVTLAPLRNIKRADLRKRNKLVVLFLTANPDPNEPLRVDAEVRRVQEAVRSSKFSDNVQIDYRPAADLQTILNGLNDLRPQIVHFSGHSTTAGLVTDTAGMEDKPLDELSYGLLAKALAATDRPPAVVVLNSCSSSGAKKDVLPKVKFLISMNVPISDIAAAAFAPQFYAALASGQSVQSAFNQGAVAVEAASISEAATPELHSNGADPSKVTLT